MWNILQNMENSTNTAMVELDLSAACDTVNHKILLDVLNKYFGIQGTVLKWINSYLTKRQCVYKLKINSLMLRWQTSQFLRAAFWALYSSPVMSVLYKNALLTTIVCQDMQMIILSSKHLNQLIQNFSLISNIHETGCIRITSKWKIGKQSS